MKRWRWWIKKKLKLRLKKTSILLSGFSYFVLVPALSIFLGFHFSFSFYGPIYSNSINTSLRHFFKSIHTVMPPPLSSILGKVQTKRNLLSFASTTLPSTFNFVLNTILKIVYRSSKLNIFWKKTWFFIFIPWKMCRTSVTEQKKYDLSFCISLNHTAHNQWCSQNFVEGGGQELLNQK